MTDNSNPDLDRDPVVAGALRRMRVPDHRAGFWADVDRRLDAVDRGDEDTDAERAERRPAERVLVPMVSVPPEAPPEDIRIATGELPAISILGEHERVHPRHTLRWLSAAAVVIAVATTAAIVSIDGGNGREGDTAGAPSASTTAAPSPPASDPVPLLSTPMRLEGDAAHVVDAFIVALGAGELATAADLLGPETIEYLESLGDVEGILSEAQEGVGGWAGADDRILTEVPIGDYGFGDITLVQVSGTYTGEGEDGFRTDAFPVVFDGDRFRVEWQGFDPELGGRPDFASPRETAEGLGPVTADGMIEVFYPLDGIVTFVLDGVLVRAIGTQPVGDPPVPYAKYEPQEGFEVGEHTLTVLFASDRAVFAATFLLTVIES